MIKKSIALMLCFLLFLTISGCGKAEENDYEELFMNGTVTQINDGSVLVIPVEGSDELASSDSFDVSTDKLDSSTDICVGDTIEVVYSGGIEETYPARFGNIISIRVISEAFDDVVLSFKDDTLTDSTATLLIQNTTEDKTFTFGPDYYLDIKGEFGWETIELDEPLVWNAIAYELKPGEQVENGINWAFGYGKLEKGEYRLYKSFCDEEGYSNKVFVEFGI